MKICIIGNDWKQQFPLIDYGGIEAAFENLCKGTWKYFPDISFCAIVPKILQKDNIDYGFKIIETNNIETSKSGLPALYFGNEVKTIIKNSNIKPDIIWSYSAWSVQALYDLGIPIICTIMDSGGWEDNKFLYRENIFYKFSSKYIYDLVFKDADKNEFISKIKSQSYWCHTGMSDDEYELCTEKEDYILWVAGLNWGLTNKGLDLFIDLAKLRSDKTFIAYGTGDQNLENYLQQLNKEIKNFNYMGPLLRGTPHRDVFKRAKLFTFLTQIPEAFGRTGLEAITKGTPVLGSTKGAVPELYSPAGLCTDNIDEMSRALDQTYDYTSIYEYSKQFHIKNEIQFLLDKSTKILNL